MKRLLVLIILLLSSSSSFSVPDSDIFYKRIVIAHRMASVARSSVESKLLIWEEPLRSAISEEFSQINLENIYISSLKKYIDITDAEGIAKFLESPSGIHLVASSYSEYDLEKLPESEKVEMRNFQNSDAGSAYLRYMSVVSEESLSVIKSKAEGLVAQHRK
jgi:hypothetical protein